MPSDRYCQVHTNNDLFDRTLVECGQLIAFVPFHRVHSPNSCDSIYIAVLSLSGDRDLGSESNRVAHSSQVNRLTPESDSYWCECSHWRWYTAMAHTSQIDFIHSMFALLGVFILSLISYTSGHYCVGQYPLNEHLVLFSLGAISPQVQHMDINIQV